jgi:ABC-type glycerol-3-phosphate transport system substrate-binding protein
MENDNTIFQSPMPAGQSSQPVSGPVVPATSGSQDDQNLPPLFSNQPASQPVEISPLASFYPPPKKNSFSGMKKKLSIFLTVFMIAAFIAILTLVIFISFNKNSTAPEQINLTYWGLFEENKIMQGIISDFEKQNPTITVQYSKQDINQYKDRLTTRIANGTGPDIFRFHNTWYPMLLTVLLPLPSDTISMDEFTNLYYPVMQKDLIKNGAIYGIPLEIDTLSLFINNDLFQSAGLSRPVTWNDFINNARTMTVKDEQGKIMTAGAGIGTYDNIAHATDIMSLLFLQNGVDFNNLQASSDKVQGALIFYTSFATDQNNIWDNTLDPSTLAFSKGNLGMFFGYSSDYFIIKQFNPNLSFQIVPVPQLPNQNVTLASYWVEGVSQKSKHQKEALLFMKFLAKKETALKLYSLESQVRDFGEPFARIDLADNLKTNPNIYTFVVQAPDASSSFFVDSTNDNGLNQQLNTYLGNAINSILNNTYIDQVIKTFIEGVSSVYPQTQNSAAVINKN